MNRSIKRMFAIILAILLVLTSAGPMQIWNGLSVVRAAVAEQESLENDETYVSDLEVTGIVDGQEPWNALDEGPSNKVVRTFDTLKYTVKYSINAYETGNSYKKGYIWFEVDLPYKEEEAYFDTAVMNWMSTDDGYMWEITKNPNGTQKLKCAKKLVPSQGNSTSIPGTGTVEIVIQVGGKEKGTTIEPVFYAYMDKNTVFEEEAQCETHKNERNQGKEYVKATPAPVTVTAAPGYNVQLTAIPDAGAYTNGTWDFSTGNDNALNKGDVKLDGRLVGFGITLQLYNENTNEGVRGIEYPTGPISFDIDLSSVLKRDGVPTSLDDDDAYIPLVWSYGPSAGDGQSFDGRDVSSTKQFTYLAAPFNSTGKTIASDGALQNPADSDSCWNGGDWKIEQNGRTLTCTISNYEVNPNWFPARNAGEITEDGTYTYTKNKNKGCFSAGELFIVVPYGQGEKYLETGTIQLNATVKSDTFSATSQSGEQVTDEKYDRDDSADKEVHITVPGNYVNRIFYGYYGADSIGFREDSDEPYNGDCYQNGKDVASIGGKVAVVWGGVSDAKGDMGNIVEAGDFLMKFDDEALSIDQSKSFAQKMSGGSHKYYYAVKPDGQSWDDDTDMRDTMIDDLLYYESLEDAQAGGRVCVGILWSWRCDHSGDNHSAPENQDMTAKAYFNIINDYSLTDKVYQILPVADIWRQKDLEAAGIDTENVNWDNVPSTYDVQQQLKTQPAKSLENEVSGVYEKSYYDENGGGGGHTAAANGWEYGDSLYLTGYLARIEKSILQKNDSDQPKTNYDLDAGQNIVDYVLKSNMILASGVEWANPTTVTITDTLPLGMKYVPGSAVRGATYEEDANGFDGVFNGGTQVEPNVVEDGDGRQVLTWTLENVSVQYTQPDIFFKAQIQSSVSNSQSLLNTATISTTEDQREHSKQNGNLSDISIMVVKLTSMSVTKSAKQSYYDAGDTIEYEIVWSNNSDNIAEKKVLLDVMPANGQNSNSFHGNATMGQLKTIVSSEPYRVYYTTSTDVYASSAEDYDYEDIVGGESPDGVSWTEIEPVNDVVDFSSIDDVTAWVVLTDIPGNNNVKVTATMDTDDNETGDRYCNIASLDAVRFPATVTIVGRTLSGTTWIDEDKDGKCETGELLLPGVTVTLQDSNGDVVVNLAGQDCQTVTDQEGNYSFDNLPPGTFKVVFTDGNNVDLDEYTLTVPSADNVDPSVNSDATPEAGGPTISGIQMPEASQMTSSNYDVVNQDAGFYPKRALAGTTWIDANNDGIRENGEDYLPGVTVTVYDSNGKILKDLNGNECQKVTDENGNYRFEDLPTGTFKVVFTNGTADLGDYMLTVPNVAAAGEEKDSDAEKKNEGPTISDIVMPTTSGEVLHQDAGFYPIRALAGTTWIDEDKDGKREDGEPRLPGVTVTVYDSEGNILKDLDGNDCKKVTDANGDYRFENLPSGTVKVVFTNSEGVNLGDYALTVPNATDVDVSVNSDATMVGNNPTISDIVMPTLSGQVLYQDAGFYPQRVLAGTTWIDDNRDGKRQDTESRLPGVKVTLYDDQNNIVTNLNGEQCQATTSLTGDYRFEDLPSGTFKVVFTDSNNVTLGDYTLTVPNATGVDTKLNSDAVETNDGPTISGIDMPTTSGEVLYQDAGFYPNRELSGTTWIDSDKDGVREDGEPPLPGVTVTLYDGNGNVVKDLKDGKECVATTDENGNYAFENLPPGNFKVVFTDGDGVELGDYTLTQKDAGTDDAIDSDATTEDDKSTISSITMPTTSAKVTHQDAGFYPAVNRVLAGTTWIDINADGECQTGEDLLPNVTVTVYDEQGKIVKDLYGNECQMTTDVDGDYRFENLPSGTFKVVFTDENGVGLENYNLTVSNATGVDASVNSDAVVKNGNPTISDIVMPKREEINGTTYEVLDQDAGFYPKRTLSGTTWIDLDKDGVREDGEPVLPGVTVTLYDENGNVVKNLEDGKECVTKTDANGDYSFENLPPGSVKVEFTDGEGVKLGDYTLTQPDAGTDDVDSDATMQGNNPSIPDIDIPTSSGDVTHQDAGFYPSVNRELSGTTWIDEDNDGIRDAEEPVLPGVTVTIYDENGNVVKDLNGNECKQETDENGDYHFEYLPSGTFDVVFTDSDDVELDDYTLTQKDAGTDDEVDSEAVEKDDKPTIPGVDIPASSGEVTHQDAGFNYNRVLEGTTWVDNDKDGIRDTNEPALPGVTVTIYDENGNVVKDLKDGKECTTKTDENGNYRFENLPSGTFTIVFTDGDTKLSDYTLTDSNKGEDDTVDNDATSGNNNPTIPGVVMPEKSGKVSHQDAGFYPTVNRALAGTTWIDSNKDGKRDAGEKVLPGVTVTLYDENGNVVKNLKDGKECVTKTDANGDYRFENLPSGTFKVVFTDGDTKLGDYTLTVANAGGDDTKDSDAASVNGVSTISGINMPKDEAINGSIYEVLYQDAGFYPNEEEDEDKPKDDGDEEYDDDDEREEEDDSEEADTGDHSPIRFLLILMLLSSLGFIIAFIARRKEYEQ